jgi:hypothetical protein
MMSLWSFTKWRKGFTYSKPPNFQRFIAGREDPISENWNVAVLIPIHKGKVNICETYWAITTSKIFSAVITTEESSRSLCKQRRVWIAK